MMKFGESSTPSKSRYPASSGYQCSPTEVSISLTMFLCELIHTLLTLLLLLSSYLTNASPTATTTNPLLPLHRATVIVNEVLPFCFNETNHPIQGTTNSHDCREALRMIYREPSRDRVFRFSKNPRSSVDVLVIPRGWQYGECVIFVSCSNTRDSAYFTFGDVAREAVKVIRDCVDIPETKYGGVEEIGIVPSFYVSVGRPVNPRRVPSELFASPVEATLVGNSSLMQAALSDFSGYNGGFTAGSKDVA